MNMLVRSEFQFRRHQWIGMVARDSELSGSAYRVAILIWDYSNKNYGYAWPSHLAIADNLGMHRSTVIRSINRLAERGWLSIERRTGQGSTNRYHLAFGEMKMRLEKDGLKKIGCDPATI